LKNELAQPVDLQIKIEDWKRADEIYRSLDAFINNECKKDFSREIQGKDQFFDELFLWNFVQSFFKQEGWSDEKIHDLKVQLKEGLPSWNFYEAAQEGTQWESVFKCLVESGVNELKIQQLKDELIQQPSLEAVKDKLFVLLEYSLFSIENDAEKRKGKIENLKKLSEYLIKNALWNKKNSEFLKPLFHLRKIYVRIMQRGLFLLLTQYSVKDVNEDQATPEGKAFIGLYSICQKGYEASLELEDALPDLETWGIQEKEGQELKDRINRFWRLFFVQPDFIGLNFLGESIEDTPEKTESKLKEKIYSVRPGNYRGFQNDADLLEKLKKILGNEINKKGEEIEGNRILGYFARMIQSNPDLEKLIPELSEEISLSESKLGNFIRFFKNRLKF